MWGVRGQPSLGILPCGIACAAYTTRTSEDKTMPNVNDLFPSNYLKAAELGKARPIVTIERWELAKLGDPKHPDVKPVIYFQGKEKGLVLNRTNAQIIESFLGSDVDGWIGKDLRLYVAQVPFQGKLVDAVRVEEPPLRAKPVRPEPRRAVAESRQTVAEDDYDDDSVPF